MNQVNALSIDVEDYFQVSNFSEVIKFSDWDKYQCRVDRNTLHVLNILSEFNVKATFFVLGWIAEKYPQLIKDIQREGHEIASHGYRHQLITEQFPKQFREDIRMTKVILEDITGSEVIGYRASTYSITKKTLWALGILAEEGYRYDASFFPIRLNSYGFPQSPRFPFTITLKGPNQMNDLNIFDKYKRSNNSNCLNARSSRIIRTDQLVNHSPLTNHRFIIEFPISTIRVLANNLPIAGGGYFRLFPYQFTKWGLKKINRKERKPFIFYIHPWEFDPDQPRVKKAPRLSRFRQYINLEKTEPKLKRLLQDFNFSTVREVLGLT